MRRWTVACFTVLSIASRLGEPPVHAGEPAGAVTAQTRSAGRPEESVQQLVVMIRSRIGDEESVGAGIIFDKRPDSLYIVTANHVVRRGSTEAGDIRVRLKMLPGESFRAKLLDRLADKDQDLAVLKVEGLRVERDLASLRLDRLGDSNAVKTSDEVYTVGQPNGKLWDVSVGDDVVTRVEGTTFAFRSLSVAPGSSGGGLFNAHRLLIGLVQRDSPPSAEAIRIDVVMRELQAGGYLVAWQVPSRSDTQTSAPVVTSSSVPGEQGRGRGGPVEQGRGRGRAPGVDGVQPWRIVGTGDFNGDRKTDILWHNRDTSHIQAWLLDVARIVGRPEVDDERGQRAVVGLPWGIVGTGDFNGDGRADILWHNRDTSHIQAWFLDGVKIIGRQEVDDERGQSAVVGLPWSIIGTGDFNGDGRADILWHNRETNRIQAWLLNGTRLVGRSEVDDERGQRAAVGLPWRIVGTGDFNGDRKVDILWHNRDDNYMQVWLLDGVKIIGRPTVADERGQHIAVGLPWFVVGTLDFNSDGRIDILWHNRDTNRIQAWLLNGTRIVGRPEVDDERDSF